MVATLERVQTKVRRITRSPSETQLTTAQINENISDFMLYDMPSQLRLFALHTTLTFYTAPNVAEYSTTNTVDTDPLFNFKNKYITLDKPVYIGGYNSYYTQSRQQFYGQWPFYNQQFLIGLGDGVTLQFTGVAGSTALSLPLLPNNVTFSAIDTDNLALTMKDVPVQDAATGKPLSFGNLYVPNTEPLVPATVLDPNNFINYLTGEFVVTFPQAPTSDTNTNGIFCAGVPYAASRPVSMLYFNDTFILRPVPDASYPVTIEVNQRPIELLAGESPYLEQWWQYIAYGAAIKVYQDRTDFDGVDSIMPEFERQKLFALRTTLVQQDTQQAVTIYDCYNGSYALNNWFGNGLY